MGVLLALAAAVGYGLSDFVGGVASRRTSAWPVALLSCLGGFLGGLLLVAVDGGAPTVGGLGWGMLAGTGSGVGTAFLYRGFAAGRMAVVAPVSAVGAALVPVAVGVALGERPGGWVWAGVVAALPGIWLVSREPEGDGSLAGGLVDGVLAGLGFGVLFVALGQVPASAGWWPLAVTQGVSLVTVAALAMAYAVPVRPTRASEAWGLFAGLAGTGSLLAFTLATRTGLLTVAAVLTSLYPAFTILLAWVVLREPIRAAQWLGLALCGVAVGLVAAG